MRPNNLFQHVKLHAVIFILGFTAILGKLISIDAISLVWYRTLIAALAIWIYLVLNRSPLVFSPKIIGQMIFNGLLIAFHWICFFHAIKVSNVAVTLGCLASTALFTSFLEPLVKRRRISWIEVGIGLIIILGLYIIFQFELRYWKGILFALGAAFLAGIFTVINEQLIKRYNAMSLSFYEMIGGWLGISLFLVITDPGSFPDFSLSLPDWVYLLVLGIICTAFAFMISIDVMKDLSAYTVVLAFNLEPVYGIIMAYLIFQDSERMTTGFYLGTLIILASVIVYPMLKRIRR